MNTTNEGMTLYAFADAGTAFSQRHPQWTAAMSRLAQVIALAFTRTQVMSTPIEKFVYFYGSLVAEDFMEIFLMAANGYGYGAIKLLRSMYEHTVTVKYLNDHPEELQAFIDFDRVQQYKVMKPIFDTFGEHVLPPHIVADTESRYLEVKHNFMVKSCKSKTCDAKRVAHTWSKLDFVSMAKKTGAVGSIKWLQRHCRHKRFRRATAQVFAEKQGVACDPGQRCRQRCCFRMNTAGNALPLRPHTQFPALI
jgi:Family of unknown function (DUF5677)